MLSHAGVPFVVRDVENDLEAYKDLLARGFRTVPVTLVDGDPSQPPIVGFNEAALHKLCGAYGRLT